MTTSGTSSNYKHAWWQWRNWRGAGGEPPPRQAICKNWDPLLDILIFSNLLFFSRLLRFWGCFHLFISYRHPRHPNSQSFFNSFSECWPLAPFGGQWAPFNQARSQGGNGGNCPLIPKIATKNFRLIILMYKPKKCFDANQRNYLRNLSYFNF